MDGCHVYYGQVQRDNSLHTCIECKSMGGGSRCRGVAGVGGVAGVVN